MAMNNKQRLFGGVVLLGGGVLLAAILLKGQHQDDTRPRLAQPVEQTSEQNQNGEASATGEQFDLQP